MKQQKEKTSWADFSRPMPRDFSLDARDATRRGMEVLADARAAQEANIARSRREAGERANKASEGIIQKMKEGLGHPCMNPVARFIPKPR